MSLGIGSHGQAGTASLPSSQPEPARQQGALPSFYGSTRSWEQNCEEEKQSGLPAFPSLDKDMDDTGVWFIRGLLPGMVLQTVSLNQFILFHVERKGRKKSEELPQTSITPKSQTSELQFPQQQRLGFHRQRQLPVRVLSDALIKDMLWAWVAQPRCRH